MGDTPVRKTRDDGYGGVTFLFVFGLAMTAVFMIIGVNRWGVGGGFAGFFIGAIMTGVLAAKVGEDLGGDGDAICGTGQLKYDC